jgi:hypothetical protein
LISQSNSYATAPTLRDTEAGKLPQKQQRETSMTALMLENLKLIMLFMLIGSIIGLSHLSGGKANPARPKGLRGYGQPATARL